VLAEADEHDRAQREGLRDGERQARRVRGSLRTLRACWVDSFTRALGAHQREAGAERVRSERGVQRRRAGRPEAAGAALAA